MIRVWSLPLASLAASLASPAAAVAQIGADVGSDSVPRRLVEALLVPSFAMWGSMMGQSGTPRLVVGVLPSTLGERLWIPPRATVLGGVTSSGMSIAILETALPADSLKEAFRREQLRRGWTEAPRREPERLMGFVPATVADDDPDRPLAFCRGSTFLSIGVEETPGSRRIFAQASDIGREVCNPSPRGMGPPSWWNDRPTLVNPPRVAAEMGQSCVNRNSGGGGSTLLITAIALPDLMSHYGAQLADSGWVAVPGDEIAQRSWTRRDSTGATHEVTLSMRRRAVSPRCVEVSMSFTGDRR